MGGTVVWLPAVALPELGRYPLGWLADLPLPTTLRLRLEGGSPHRPEVELTTSRTYAAEEPLALTPREYEPLAEALRLGRVVPTWARWRLGCNPEARRPSLTRLEGSVRSAGRPWLGWSIQGLANALGARLVAARVHYEGELPSGEGA